MGIQKNNENFSCQGLKSRAQVVNIRPAADEGIGFFLTILRKNKIVHIHGNPNRTMYIYWEGTILYISI